jgi:carbon-monoxide dehydrogenase medium subunit
MKPPRFEYFAPESVDEALGLLRQHGYDAKVLAGGQSLMPLLNMRLARPAVIVDINRIQNLDNVDISSDGGLTLGGMVRHRVLEESAAVALAAPVLAHAAAHIGHSQIRNRGTVGGSLVHADPAAELPAVAVALEAKFVLRSATGQRTVEAGDFFIAYLTTATEPDELLTEVQIPGLDGDWGWGFHEVCRRDGDFALAGAVALVRTTDSGVCDEARLAFFGVGGTPMRVPAAEEALLGTSLDDRALEAVARLVQESLDPDSDIHASKEYRKEVGAVVARRSLEDARTRLAGRET